MFFLRSQRTVAVHLDFQTLAKSTSLTLVPSVQVNNTAAALFAHIVQIPPDTPFEKSTTSVTARYTVMLAGSLVTAHSAKLCCVSWSSLARRRGSFQRGSVRTPNGLVIALFFTNLFGV